MPEPNFDVFVTFILHHENPRRLKPFQGNVNSQAPQLNTSVFSPAMLHPVPRMMSHSDNMDAERSLGEENSVDPSATNFVASNTSQSSPSLAQTHHQDGNPEDENYMQGIDVSGHAGGAMDQQFFPASRFACSIVFSNPSTILGSITIHSAHLLLTEKYTSPAAYTA